MGCREIVAGVVKNYATSKHRRPRLINGTKYKKGFDKNYSQFVEVFINNHYSITFATDYPHTIEVCKFECWGHKFGSGKIKLVKNFNLNGEEFVKYCLNISEDVLSQIRISN